MRKVWWQYCLDGHKQPECQPRWCVDRKDYQHHLKPAIVRVSLGRAKLIYIAVDNSSRYVVSQARAYDILKGGIPRAASDDLDAKTPPSVPSLILGPPPAAAGKEIAVLFDATWVPNDKATTESCLYTAVLHMVQPVIYTTRHTQTPGRVQPDIGQHLRCLLLADHHETVTHQLTEIRVASLSGPFPHLFCARLLSSPSQTLPGQ